ncbi:hypothetical protein Tco_0869057 [Tanacetum coccineum]
MEPSVFARHAHSLTQAFASKRSPAVLGTFLVLLIHVPLLSIKYNKEREPQKVWIRTELLKRPKVLLLGNKDGAVTQRRGASMNSPIRSSLD